MKQFIKVLIWILIILAVSFGAFLLYITLADYRPEKAVTILKKDVNELPKPGDSVFRLITWNIGYAGLGAEMDFFYDGGTGVRPSKDLNVKYLEGIKDFLATWEADFYLLQEVDIHSGRSYRINQKEILSNMKPELTAMFAMNYKVPFVPVPVSSPMGTVKGGMLTLSVPEPYDAVRFAYPLIASWPERLFLLDRCMILSRYRLQNGKDLVLINTHNSAYVYDTALRNQEFGILKKSMLEEFDKGNYVIAGGDWNANPPEFSPAEDFNGHRYEPSKVKMEADFLPPGWQWAYGKSVPTNRHNDTPYQKGRNGTGVIDYFVVSPNVAVNEVRTIDLQFVHSDHNPVWLEIKLIQ